MFCEEEVEVRLFDSSFRVKVGFLEPVGHFILEPVNNTMFLA
jgi:hypothetical protein